MAEEFLHLLIVLRTKKHLQKQSKCSIIKIDYEINPKGETIVYCKNCGKELPDNARFCDKCNMSVRKKEGKMDMIEELKEERLARKKAYEIEERLKKIKKVKRKRYRAVVLMILGVVAVWGAIVGFSFWNNYKDSTLRDAEPELKATEVPGATPEATEEVDIGKYVSITINGIEAAGGTEAMHGIEITYPAMFSRSEVEDMDCVASFSTDDGEAKLIIDRKKATQTPNELMDEYYRGVLNAKSEVSSATGEGYTITLSAGTKQYHKKCVIKDGDAISYEIIYPRDKADEYKEYIEYMDERFTVS